MPKETLNVRVEAETREALEAIAAALDRDRSHVVNEALAAYVETHRWQVEHIRQGLREAESGKFVSGADVKKVVARPVSLRVPTRPCTSCPSVEI
jgi:predicted transcriptional regulator